MTRPIAPVSSPSVSATLDPAQQLDPDAWVQELLAGFDQELSQLPPDSFGGGSPIPRDPPVASQQAAHAHRRGHHGGTDFNISSFNVLGASHTKPGGEHPGHASGVRRMHAAVKAIQKHDVDVVGFQELQHPQLREFQKLTHGKFGVFPGFKGAGGDTENSIAWDKSKFSLVKARTIEIPYFNGHKREMPIVILRDKETGQKAVFTNFHNPADTKRFHHQERFRDRATNIEIAMVKRLEKHTGLPVFVTGDMNESAEYFRRMTGGTDMHSAHKAGHHGDQRHLGIDHIYGSPEVKFSDFVRDRSSLIRFASDHPMLVSHVHIRG